MKPKDSRRIPLSCKYWHKGMAKTNYRKHKGRQRNKILEEAIAELQERSTDVQLERIKI